MSTLKTIGLVTAGLLLATSIPAQAAAEGARSVSVADLKGLTPDAVQVAAAGGRRHAPPFYDLETHGIDGDWAFVLLGDLIDDDIGHENALRSRTNSEVERQGSRCIVADAAGGASEILLAFHAGRLDDVWRGPPPSRARLDPADQPGTAWPQALGFVREPTSTLVSVICRRGASGARLRRPPDIAGDLQGLALLPFAIQLPGMNARRAAAARRGGALYASLVPGAAVPADLPRRPGVRSFLSDDSPTLLLAIDLGGPPTRNLTARYEEGLVGVRRGRVVWRVHARTPMGQPVLQPPASPRR